MQDPIQHETFQGLRAALTEEQARAETASRRVMERLEGVRAAFEALTDALATGAAEAAAGPTGLREKFEAFEEFIRQNGGSDAESAQRAERLESELTAQRESFQAMEARVRLLEQELGDRVAETNAARGRTITLEEALEQSRAELEAAKGHASALQAEIQQHTESAADAEGLAAQLQEAEARARVETGTLRAQLEEANAQAEKERAAASEARGQLEAAQAESRSAIEALEGQLQAAQEEAGRLRDELNGMGAEAGTLRAQAEEAERGQAVAAAELARMRTAAEGAVEEIQTLREHAARAQTFSEQLAVERARTRELEQQIQQELAKGGRSVLAAQLTEAIRETEQVQEEMRGLRAELAALRAAAAAAAPGESRTTESDAERVLAWVQGGGPVRPIGETFVEVGILEAGQLEEALDEQRRSPNRHIGAILIEKGLASEEAVAQALACQAGVKFVRLDESAIHPETAASINQRLANQHMCVPVRMNGDILVLAMGNPLDLVAIEDVERATGRKVEVVVSTMTEIKSAIDKYFWEPE